MSQIARSTVIPGAGNDGFHVDGLVHCDHAQPVQITVTFDAAAVRGLDTPVDLVEPVPGKKIVPLGVYYSKESGAYGAGAAITFNYKSNAQVASIPLSVMTNSAAVTGWATRSNQSGQPDAQPVPELPIEIKTATAFTGNGGDLTITLIYLEVDA